MSNFFLIGLALFQQGRLSGINLLNMGITQLPKLSEIIISYERKNNGIKIPSISSSIDAVNLSRYYFDQKKIEYCEEFKIMYLNRQNLLLGVLEHSKGGVSSTVVDIKQILGAACKANASSLILIHNHPSGNLRPSETDIRLTNKIKTSCELMDLSLIDHLILTRESYYSFADEGIL